MHTVYYISRMFRRTILDIVPENKFGVDLGIVPENDLGIIPENDLGIGLRIDLGIWEHSSERWYAFPKWHFDLLIEPESRRSRNDPVDKKYVAFGVPYNYW